MSYSKPVIQPINAPGLDGAITALQTSIASLPWLAKSFHRAYLHQEVGELNRLNLRLPKVWEGKNEWLDVLPNDNVVSQSFFWPISDESIMEYEKPSDPTVECDIALIVWVNTKKLAGHISGPSLAVQKADVINLLKVHPATVNILSVTDRSAEDIFDPFTIDDQNTHRTMLPYAGFRVEFTVKFDYIQCEIASS